MMRITRRSRAYKQMRVAALGLSYVHVMQRSQSCKTQSAFPLSRRSANDGSASNTNTRGREILFSFFSFSFSFFHFFQRASGGFVGCGLCVDPTPCVLVLAHEMSSTWAFMCALGATEVAQIYIK